MAQPVDRPVIVVENRMVDEARQGFLVAWWWQTASFGVGGGDRAARARPCAGGHWFGWPPH
jgi:hypothetical protein